MTTGTRIGNLNGISVYETDWDEYRYFEKIADFKDLGEVLYWLIDDCTLRYGGSVVGHVNRKGEVDDFREELFNTLREQYHTLLKKEEERKEREIAETAPQSAEEPESVEEILADESLVSAETADIDILLAQSRVSVDDLLIGFECTANRFLEELKAQK